MSRIQGTCYKVIALDKSYQELLKMVEEIEGSSTKAEFASINISPLQSLKLKGHKPPFQPLLGMAMDMESGYSNKGAARPQPQRQQAAASQPLHPPPQPPQPRPQQPVDPEEMQQRDLQARIAKEEISMFADRLDQKADQPQQPNEIDTKEGQEMSLAALSVPDQISEVEKIIEGLFAGSFSESQKVAIKQRLKDLKDKSAIEAKQNQNKGARKIDQELDRLRDQQLDEAITMLGSSQ